MSSELTEAERELIVAEAEHFATRVQNPVAREAYDELYTQAKEGRIDKQLFDVLGGLLEIGLSSGRIRTVHGAHAELAARGLFRRTPQGQALQTQISEVNKALEALEGQEIQKISLSVQGPAIYALSIKTTDLELKVSLKPSGVEVRTVEISL